MQIIKEKSWNEKLKNEFSSTYFSNLQDFIKNEYANYNCYPIMSDIFQAFESVSFENVKVVIIGQDPYHHPSQAHGLSFSVKYGIKLPPSLKNIFKEIKTDLGLGNLEHGDLTRWATQGVLLLNSVLTVRESSPGSHANRGWEIFSDRVIELINSEKNGVVFMLWGAYAIKKGGLINRERHLVLEASHPSPFSAYKGFLGCKHFSLCNQYLKESNQTEIDWS